MLVISAYGNFCYGNVENNQFKCRMLMTKSETSHPHVTKGRTWLGLAVITDIEDDE